MPHDDAALCAMSAFTRAWKKSINDYQSRKINSERCLQASLYFHLRTALSTKYTIYVEALVLLPSTEKVFVDMLICYQTVIVAAIELKYKPKMWPGKAEVAADLDKLSQLRSRRATADRVDVLLRRYRTEDENETVRLSFSPERRVVFAAYCTNEAASMNRDTFWSDHRPVLASQFWKRLATMPPRLAVYLAKTRADGTAKPHVFGRGCLGSKPP